MKDLEAYASLRNELNPMQLDPSYAESTSFGKPVVHALLTATLFSNLVETKLPGPGSILAGQMLRFLKPVYLGETVTATVEIVGMRPEEGVVRLATRATTRRGLCVDGEAVVDVSRRRASHA